MATYTDKELQLATQIAYINVTDTYTSFTSEGQTSVSLRELADRSDTIRTELEQKGIPESLWDKWSITAVGDNNDATGFAACIIDTGDGNAITAFRGSEAMGTDETSLKNIQHDWIEADLGLLNSTETNQYRDAQQFLKDNAALLNSYDKVNLTGHSLGGNLAEYSTIIADECGVGKNFERCVSFDGPGFSQEFIDHYRELIDKNAGKVDHYKWSFVGSMLKELPGEHSKFIQVTINAVMIPVIGGFVRHSTDYIDFDENGNVKEGHQDFIAAITEKFSNLVDDLPAPIGDTLRDIIATGMMAGFSHPEISIPILVLFAYTHPGVVAVAAAVVLIEFYGEFREWIYNNLINYVCEAISSTIEWAAEKISEFCAAVVQAARDFAEWCKRTFDADYRAAQDYLAVQNVLRFHTDDLRSLAGRLWAVNGRLGALDERIDGLYWKVKWTDLWNLMSSDLKICWSDKINGCANCLNDTAQRFEDAERQILSMMEG
ncbi:MAG: DUF2974 domain-containing protein [Ruminococcus sp.]|nr:DUF2974 domain-containing protein [Ruminococcus sp.]